jgi:hypothetical protein
MIRVLKKCYDFSKENSILLVPFKESSKKGNSSIYNTVIENDKFWESNRSKSNVEILEY